MILDIKTSPQYVRRRNWRESLRARWLLFRNKPSARAAAPEEDDAPPNGDPENPAGVTRE